MKLAPIANRYAVPAALAAALSVAGLPALLAQSDTGFPAEAFAARRARLASLVGDAPVIVPGAYLIRSGGAGRQDPTFFYLTGVHSPYAILVMRRTEHGVREVLFLPEPNQFAGAQYPFEDARLRHATWNRPIKRWSPGAAAEAATGIAETRPIDELVDRLPELLADAPLVYFARDNAERYAPPGLAAPTSARQQLERSLARRFKRARIEDVTPLVARLRLIKDAYEIAALTQAAAVSAAGLREAMQAVRPGMRDLEVAGLMEAAWKRAGAPRAAFGPIVSSGPASLTLYTLRSEAYDYGDRIMQAGDLLFIDYGAAEYQMYASDICRTIPVSGKFSPIQRYYYEIVLEAQTEALELIRPGVMMLDVIKAAAQVFRKYGFEEFEDVEAMGIDRVWGIMPSPTHYLTRNGGLTEYSGARGTGVRDLGHHIGLEALDSRDYSMPLEPGMVFTVEPKLYIPDDQIAIMIEDMILVTDDGYENLSAGAPRTVRDIERIMAVDSR